MKFEIERGVPIPPAGCTKRNFPFYDMQVGDSFYVPNTTAKRLGGSMTYAKMKTGFQFTTRSENGGVRVWRIA